MEVKRDDDNPFTHAFCSVCGESSPSVHYGALSCAGCAAFYKRSVLRQKGEVCTHDGQCPVTPTTRSQCRACRFQKCLKAGMKFAAKDAKVYEAGRKKLEILGESSSKPPVSKKKSASSADGPSTSHVEDGISEITDGHDTGTYAKAFKSARKPSISGTLSLLHIKLELEEPELDQEAQRIQYEDTASSFDVEPTAADGRAVKPKSEDNHEEKLRPLPVMHVSCACLDSLSLTSENSEMGEDMAAFLQEYGVDVLQHPVEDGLDGVVDLSDGALPAHYLEEMVMCGTFGSPSVPSAAAGPLVPVPSASRPPPQRQLFGPDGTNLSSASSAVQFQMHQIIDSVTSTDIWREPMMGCSSKVTDNSFRPYELPNFPIEPPVADGFRFSDFMGDYLSVLKERLGCLDQTMDRLKLAFEEVFTPTLIRTAAELLQSILNRAKTPQHEADFGEVLMETRGLLNGVQHKGHEFLAKAPGFDMFSVADREVLMTDTTLESLLVTDGFTWNKTQLQFHFTDTVISINEYGVRAIFDKEFLDFAFEFGSHYKALKVYGFDSFAVLAVLVFRPGGPKVSNQELLGFLHMYYIDVLLHAVSFRQNLNFSQAVLVHHLASMLDLIKTHPEMSARCKRCLNLPQKPRFYFCICSPESLSQPGRPHL